MDTKSLWHAGASLPTHAPLAGDTEADVCVVGGGIAGLTAAYLLREGRSVVLVDDQVLHGPSNAPLSPVQG